MSAGTGQWIRRSPSSKQGPLKATLPMSSLTRQNSNLKQTESNSSCSISPSTSFWKVTASPEATSCGLRSPGAINYKGKCKNVRSQSAHDYSNISMRRTASLDTIYLTGHWPRESMYLSNLQVDRSTQTEDWIGDQSRKGYVRTHQDVLASTNEDKLEKFIRHRLQRTKESVVSSKDRSVLSLLSSAGSLGNSSYGAGCSSAESSISNNHDNILLGDQQHTGGHIVTTAAKGGSIEGLNQEIERLVLRSSIAGRQLDRQHVKGCCESTPEGHRAPVADLLRQTRSVNTQTPAYTSTNSAHSSGPPSCDSGSPAGSALTNRSDSRPSSDLQEDSSPETEGRQLGTSPRINRFLEREPPDGCERVSLRFTDENRKPMVDISEMDYPLKPSVNFQLKPSLGSAFQPLKSTQ
ncbi:glucocorticoid-induced transcript 1 protein-like isoform X2 [Rhodnius prolixus]|uniref:glucocorticoid-induced transcript 1 protein-like isoform X2 n=1 Tax=Rhodnius prolixus TaxID=13249 RepID=UPI003D18F767